MTSLCCRYVENQNSTTSGGSAGWRCERDNGQGEPGARAGHGVRPWLNSPMHIRNFSYIAFLPSNGTE